MVSNSQHKISIIGLFIVILSTVIFVWYLIPNIKYQYVSTIVGIGVIALTLIIVLCSPCTRMLYGKLIGITLTYSLLYYFIPGGLVPNIGFLPVLEYSMYIFPIILTFSIISRGARKEAFILIVALSIMFYIVYQATMIMLIKYPFIARDLAQGGSSEKIMEWRMGNVGGFGFSYCAAPVGLLLLELVFKTKRLYKVIFAFLLVYVSIFIFLAQYTTLLIFYAVGTGILIYKNITHPLLRIFLILSLIAFFLFMGDVFSLISNATEEGGFTALSHHFDDMADASQGAILRTSRRKLAIAALKVWLDSPIWGNWGVALPSSPLYMIVMPAHSGVATILASLGVVGLYLHFLFLYYAWKYIHLKLKDRNCRPLVFDVSVIFLVIIDFINPINNLQELALMTFLFVPFTIYYFKKYFEINAD